MELVQTEAACTTASADWNSDATVNYDGNPAGCELKEGEYLAGAATAVSALNIFYTVDEDGIRGEQSAATADDIDSLNCVDPAPTTTI